MYYRGLAGRVGFPSWPTPDGLGAGSYDWNDVQAATDRLQAALAQGVAQDILVAQANLLAALTGAAGGDNEYVPPAGSSIETIWKAANDVYLAASRWLNAQGAIAPSPTVAVPGSYVAPAPNPWDLHPVWGTDTTPVPAGTTVNYGNLIQRWQQAVAAGDTATATTLAAQINAITDAGPLAGAALETAAPGTVSSPDAIRAESVRQGIATGSGYITVAELQGDYAFLVQYLTRDELERGLMQSPFAEDRQAALTYLGIPSSRYAPTITITSSTGEVTETHGEAVPAEALGPISPYATAPAARGGAAVGGGTAGGGAAPAAAIPWVTLAVGAGVLYLLAGRRRA
jgi:hypothetical protein